VQAVVDLQGSAPYDAPEPQMPQMRPESAGYDRSAPRAARKARNGES